MKDDRKYVYLAYVKNDSGERVVVRGVFDSAYDAAALFPLKGEERRNIVSVFEGVDMGMHVGFAL